MYELVAMYGLGDDAEAREARKKVFNRLLQAKKRLISIFA